MMSSRTGQAAILLALLATSTVLECRAASPSVVSSDGSSSEASSDGSSSAAETILTFTATISARRHRALLQRPTTTCGSPALLKDGELNNVNDFLMCLATTMDVPRTSVTAYGAQVTEGTGTLFTVLVLGNTDQLGAYSAGVICGATTSAGTTNVAGAFHPVNFDGGNKNKLNDNLLSFPPAGAPNVIRSCVVPVAADVNQLTPVTTTPGATTTAAATTTRRHLLADPTADDITLWEPVVDEVLDILAANSGVAREFWTSSGLSIDNGGLSGSYFIFCYTDNPNAIIANWDTITDLGTGIEFGEPQVVPESQAPLLGNSLAFNLNSPVSDFVYKVTIIQTENEASTVIPPDQSDPAYAPSPVA